MNYGRLRLYFTVAMVFGIAILVLLIVTSYLAYIQTRNVDSPSEEVLLCLHYFTYILIYGAYLSVIELHCFMLWSLTQRFININNLLWWVIKCYSTFSCFGMLTGYFWKSKRFLDIHNELQVDVIEIKEIEAKCFVRKMSHLYEKLCAITDDVNYCYSFQVSVFLFGRLHITAKPIKIDFINRRWGTQRRCFRIRCPHSSQYIVTLHQKMKII